MAEMTEERWAELKLHVKSVSTTVIEDEYCLLLLDVIVELFNHAAELRAENERLRTEVDTWAENAPPL